jgi:hypothetical protein
MTDWDRDWIEGRGGVPRRPDRVTPGYAAGQRELQAGQRPIPVSPEAGAWMACLIGVPVLGALGAVAVAAVTGNDLGTWARTAGGVAFTAMLGLMVAVAALALAVGIIRTVLEMLPGLIVLAAFAAAVLLALSVFGVGPGLTFL